MFTTGLRPWLGMFHPLRGFKLSQSVMKVIEYNKAAGNKLLKRLEGAAFPPDKVAAVRKIVEEVRRRGDAALRDFTRKYDGAKLKLFAVSPEEIRSARKSLTPELRGALRRAEKNIADFYRPTRERSWRRGRGDGLELSLIHI